MVKGLSLLMAVVLVIVGLTMHLCLHIADIDSDETMVSHVFLMVSNTVRNMRYIK